MLERWKRVLRDHVLANSVQMTHEPEGQLHHPYTVLGSTSGLYTGQLWDWDSWIVSIVLGQVELDTDTGGKFSEYERGCVLNFLDHTDPDGVMPIQMSPLKTMTHGDPSRASGFSANMHKPVLAQHAAMLTQRAGSAAWIAEHMEVIGRFIDRYLESHVHAATGLAYWQSDFAIGVDNDPSVYYRPKKSTAAVYLNSLLYRELVAYGYLWEELGEISQAQLRRGQAQDLADAMNAHLWDERDGTYYSADLALTPIDPTDWLHQGAPRSWSSLLLRIDSWSSFMPLWAGVASREQAERMVQRIRDPRTFQAAYGIRSLSRLEKMYNVRASNNPSNWLGPVWGIANYLVFRGLVKYGFDEDARDLAEKTVRLYGRDVETSGDMHEFYHPDSGEPIMTKGYHDWNFLVLNMIAWLEERPVLAEF